MATKFRGSEGPKRSVAKSTAVNRIAASKRASVKRSSAEGPKKSTSKPTSMQSYMAKNPPRIVESGVGNIPMTIARAGKAAVDFFKGPAVKVTPKPSSFKSTTSGVSKKTGGPLKNGKPVKLGPRNKTSFTPAEKAARTRAMKKARAAYAAEGPKKSVSSARTTAFTNKRVMGAGAAVGGTTALAAAASKRGSSPKSNSLPKGASMGKMVWNGSTWVKKK